MISHIHFHINSESEKHSLLSHEAWNLAYSAIHCNTEPITHSQQYHIYETQVDAANPNEVPLTRTKNRRSFLCFINRIKNVEFDVLLETGNRKISLRPTEDIKNQNSNDQNRSTSPVSIPSFIPLPSYAEPVGQNDLAILVLVTATSSLTCSTDKKCNNNIRCRQPYRLALSSNTMHSLVFLFFFKCIFFFFDWFEAMVALLSGRISPKLPNFHSKVHMFSYVYIKITFAPPYIGE